MDVNARTIEVTRELREETPAHFIFRIENFSQLWNSKFDSYESSDFEVGGYKWKLRVYAKGNTRANENKHISLYLARSDSFVHGEVKAYIKLFVYDHSNGMYLTVQDAKGRLVRFHGMETEKGFNKLLPLDVFTDPSKGYLMNDCCVFGAEVFILPTSCQGECASVIGHNIGNDSYLWELHKIQNYRTSKPRFILSRSTFLIAGSQWALKFYSSTTLASVPFYLCLEKFLDSATFDNLYVEYSVTIKNHWSKEEYELLARYNFFNTSKCSHAGTVHLSEKSRYGESSVEVKFLLITENSVFSNTI